MARYRIVMPETAQRMEALLAARRFHDRLMAAGAGWPLGAAVQGEHVRADGRFYFEVDFDDEDRLREEARGVGAAVEPGVHAPHPDPCLNCGNVSEVSTTVCPSCSFREIDRCPHCDTEVPRLRYAEVAQRVFQCPSCQHLVRMAYNEPLWDDEGHYTQPVVLVVRVAA